MSWSSAGPIRDIFKTAFQHAGISYFNPHSFRDTLVILGEQICKTPEQFKAWSQNLGHESPLTTFTSYGKVSLHRQRELIRGAGKQDAQDEKLNRVLKFMALMEGRSGMTAYGRPVWNDRLRLNNSRPDKTLDPKYPSFYFRQGSTGPGKLRR